MRVFRSEKYCPDVVGFIRKMLDIGVDRVIVITGPLDQKETYAEILGSFSEEEVSALYVEGYTAPNCWSLALNAGINFLWDNKVL